MKTCLVSNVTNIVGKKWTFILLQEIAQHQEEGFNALFRRLRKISPKVLSQRLNQLEQGEMIKKKTHTLNHQQRTTYSLTEKGEEMYKITRGIKTWAEKYDPSLKCTTLSCTECSRY